MPFVNIPASRVTLGEGPDAHPCSLAPFRLARYPVTNVAYGRFVAAAAFPPPVHWAGPQPPGVLADHPVVNVTWHEARAFCRWLSRRTGHDIRLPTEAEWEWAARGPAGQTFPWGNAFLPGHCNTWEEGTGRTMPVDSYPAGASGFGVQDMAGNVWEWCSTAFADYPYDPRDGREDLDQDTWRVLRGGSWYDTGWGVRAARRLGSPADYRSHNTGFRVAAGLKPEGGARENL